MWEDVIVGKGTKGWSAIKVFAIPGDHSISESSSAYWISHCVLDIGMTIFKDTKEGKKLTKMIDETEEPAVILEWLDLVALKHIEPSLLKAKIEQATKAAFKNGRRDKAMEIREVLGSA